MEQSLAPNEALVVLAGGASSRMGQAKARLPDPSADVRGGTLLDRALRVGREALRLSAGAQGGRTYMAEMVYVSGAIEGYPCIPDIFPGCGPLSGIHAALEKLYGLGVSRVLFAPVDMPGLTPVLCSRLLRSLGEAELIQYEDFELPLAAVNTEGLRTWLGQKLENAHVSTKKAATLALRELRKTFSIKQLSLDPTERNLFLNLNTPNEFVTWYTGESL